MEFKELKALISGLVAIEKAAFAVAADGKVSVEDLGVLLPLLPKLLAVVGGAGSLPAELSALTPEAEADLVAYAMSELALEEGKAKNIVAASLKMAAHLAADAVDLVKAIRG